MLAKTNVLIIDNMSAGWESMISRLENKGASVELATSSADGCDRLAHGQFHIVLLGPHIPDSDPLELIKQIKTDFSLPVIAISDTSDSMEAVLNLEVGADDFISHPFAERELVARIKAALRLFDEAKQNGKQDIVTQKDDPVTDNTVIHFGEWCIDRDAMKVTDRNENELDLTTGEYRLLEALVLSARVVLTREKLFELTREEDFDGYDRAVDVQIARIRKKMNDNADDPKYIKTVRGVGYMLDTRTKAVNS